MKLYNQHTIFLYNILIHFTILVVKYRFTMPWNFLLCDECMNGLLHCFVTSW